MSVATILDVLVSAHRIIISSYLIGPTLYLYGAAGPSYGSYDVSIDGTSNVSTAYASTNATNYLLYGTSGLTYDNHTLKVTNLGSQSGDEGGDEFLFDYLQTTVQLAPAG